MIVADIEITEPWVMFEGDQLPPEEGLSMRRAENLYECEVYINGFRIGRLAAPIEMGLEDYSIYEMLTFGYAMRHHTYTLKVLLEPQHTRAPT